jgi:hypothetical protein
MDRSTFTLRGVRKKKKLNARTSITRAINSVLHQWEHSNVQMFRNHTTSIGCCLAEVVQQLLAIFLGARQGGEFCIALFHLGYSQFCFLLGLFYQSRKLGYFLFISLYLS